jgi:hypothetical protein
MSKGNAARRRTLSRGTTLMAIGLCACACQSLNPLDRLGQDQASRQDSSLEGEPKGPVDDRIEDKQPTYRPDAVVVESFDGCDVELNKSAAVTKLDVGPLDEQTGAALGKRFATRGAALEALSASGVEVIPSLEVVQGAMKPFNDGLYAAVELVVQHGDAAFVGKQKLLAQLLEQLLTLNGEASPAQRQALAPAIIYLAAGRQLGGGSLPGGMPNDLKAAVEREAEAFADEHEGQPVGFYNWSTELQQIFRQDRYLQRDRLLRPGRVHPSDRESDIRIFAGIALALSRTLLDQRLERVRIEVR